MVEQLSRTPTFKERLYVIVFESDTRAGLLFDKILIYTILLSLLSVIFDSIEPVAMRFHHGFSVLEWIFTLAFSIEYIIRVYCSKKRMGYVLSFYGIVDLLAVIPTYLALFFPDLHALIDVRVLRLIRVFRVFKLTAYMHEYAHLSSAFSASRRKITVFLSVVLAVVMVMGTLMYVVEGPQHGFTNIPVGIYWAITTMTTVGYGDVTPKTDLGQMIAAVMMLMGWGTLAVPTGIMTAEMSRQHRDIKGMVTCSRCGKEGLEPEDRYCRQCGEKLPG